MDAKAYSSDADTRSTDDIWKLKVDKINQKALLTKRQSKSSKVQPSVLLTRKIMEDVNNRDNNKSKTDQYNFLENKQSFFWATKLT